MVRTRIAPSPTGEDLHIGNLYTAYLNWVFAKKNGGQFIVRIEDTDRTRLVKGSEDKILKTLELFGLTPDEKPIRQSERLLIYKEHAEKLIESGAAYYCFCTKERLDLLRESQKKEKKPTRYDKHCLNTIKNAKERIERGESYVVRLNIFPDKKMWFKDIIHGEIGINSNEIDDQVLLKSDGYPTYHLAVVVDDYLMKISHVIRAEEWISSTPKHVLLYELFGWEPPVFAHIPILRNPDRSKLSKRKNPVWASWYLSQGYLPEAVLNYLALMGWSHPEGKEIFSKEEFIEKFSLERVQAAGPVFDIKKLEWMNGEYIRKMKNEKLKMKIVEFFKNKYQENLVEKTVPLVQERIKTLKEYDMYCQFFIERPKAYEMDITKNKELLSVISNQLSVISKSDWTAETIGQKLQEVGQNKGVPNSKFFMIVRIAITGKKVTPPLNESMEILGKEECLDRLTVVK